MVDDLVSTLAGADQGDGDTERLGDPVDVGACAGGQGREFGDRRDVLVPAGDLLVHRLARVKDGLVVGKFAQALALARLVGDAELEGVEPGQDIELGQRDLGDARDADRVSQRHQVEPPAPTLAPGRGAELVALLQHVLSRGVIEFGRERALADACHVRLGDAKDTVDACRTDARPGAGRARDRVGRRHERVRPVVDVEHRPLRALKQHALACVERPVDQQPRVGDERPQTLGVAQDLLSHSRRVEWLHLVELLQNFVLLLKRDAQLAHQDAGVQKVLRPDAKACRLVLVTRPDAAAGRADREAAEPHFGRTVKQHVVRHDQVCRTRHAQAFDRDAALLEGVELAAQDPRIDDRPVADDAELARVEDPRGNQMQFEGLAVAHDRVSGVVAALKAHDHVAALGEQVDDLALAFVAPLGADDHRCRSCHRVLGLSCRVRGCRTWRTGP